MLHLIEQLFAPGVFVFLVAGGWALALIFLTTHGEEPESKPSARRVVKRTA